MARFLGLLRRADRDAAAGGEEEQQGGWGALRLASSAGMAPSAEDGGTEAGWASAESAEGGGGFSSHSIGILEVGAEDGAGAVELHAAPREV